MKRVVKSVFGRLLSANKKSSTAPHTARKVGPAARKRVWRISERAPQGAWVDADAAMGADTAPSDPDRALSGWTTSSMDLLSGAEVREYEDTAPAVLYDGPGSPAGPDTRNPFDLPPPAAPIRKPRK